LAAGRSSLELTLLAQDASHRGRAGGRSIGARLLRGHRSCDRHLCGTNGGNGLGRVLKYCGPVRKDRVGTCPVRKDRLRLLALRDGGDVTRSQNATVAAYRICEEDLHMSAKKIAPAAIVALKEALTNLYWYKGDLRSFLTSTLTNPVLLSRLNWNDYKRNIAGALISYLEQRQDEYQADLLKLMTEVARVDDFSHLERLEGGREKASTARASVQALRKLTGAHEALFEEQRRMEERRRKVYETLLRTTVVKTKLEDLAKEYFKLLNAQEPQLRGYRLEKVIRELFELFDLDPRASFKIVGEQIDGAFTFDSADYLFEGKWQQELVGAADLDVLAGKLSRKLDNTLGLFLSVNGFSEDGVKAHSSGRRMMLLMDGSDFMAVLEGRIDLIQLLLRKRREASQTGNIYIRLHEIL